MDKQSDFERRLEAMRPPRRSPPGFTRAPEIRDILDRYEGEQVPGGIVRFTDLPASDAARLLALLPSWQENDQQHIAPTFREFVEAGQSCPSMTFSGYRVMPERSDERITIDSIIVPVSSLPNEAVQEIWEFSPPSQASIDYERDPDELRSEDDDIGTSMDILGYSDIDIYMRTATEEDKEGKCLIAWWD